MAYKNACKRCNHGWVSTTEAGPAKICPKCRTESTQLLSFTYEQDPPVTTESNIKIVQAASTLKPKLPKQKPGLNVKK